MWLITVYDGVCQCVDVPVPWSRGLHGPCHVHDEVYQCGGVPVHGSRGLHGPCLAHDGASQCGDVPVSGSRRAPIMMVSKTID